MSSLCSPIGLSEVCARVGEAFTVRLLASQSRPRLSDLRAVLSDLRCRTHSKIGFREGCGAAGILLYFIIMSPKESPSPRGRLATQLDEWALIREKVLGKLDIRGAREARSLAYRIRGVIFRMGEESSDERPASMVELRALCAQANLLLEDDGMKKRPQKEDERATLPVPSAVAKARRLSRATTISSGIQSAVKAPDQVKNHALRRR
jgi:hypothetical protein